MKHSKPKGASKAGRPSTYTPELADLICERIANGESLRRICEDEAMPDRETVRRWMRKDEAFRGRFAGAREEQADALADEILSIADETAHDTIITEKGEIPNGEWMQRSKLRVDARFKLMALLAPKKYGSKLDVTSDGKPLPASTINVRIIGGDGPPIATDEDGA